MLGNAKNVRESEILNGVSELSFSMPYDDPKNEYCTPFMYVRWEEGPFYRLLDTAEASGGEELITYQCEHVIATLIDDTIFQSLQLDNWETEEVIQRILSMQETRRWIFGGTDLPKRYFSYSWSNENLLAALFSIPNRFDEAYRWEFDTSVNPWTIYLKKLDENAKPGFYVRGGKNLLSSSRNNKGRDICTRLYALGYGEGINQLTFANLNDGRPYLDASPEAIAKYGLITRIWEDARIEREETLLERAQIMVDKLSRPYEAYTLEAADIYKLTGESLDRAAAGKTVDWDGYRTYILRVERQLDGEGVETIEMANEPEDIASSIAQLADRQRINSVYAQGATCLYSQSFADNADASRPLVIDLYIPQEAKVINKVNLTWRIEAFRSYSTGAASGGGSTTSAQSGGGQTTTSGGAQTIQSSARTSGSSSRSTSDSGFVTVQANTGIGSTNASTSGVTGLHSHTFSYVHNHTVNAHSHGMDHSHSYTIPQIDIPSHAHTVSAHSHSVTIPEHSHAIQHGIYTGPRAGSVTLRVAGVNVPLAQNQTEIDIADKLGVDNSGSIRRGTWHTIEIIPNSLTRISGAIISQLFIQSEGGGRY